MSPADPKSSSTPSVVIDGLLDVDESRDKVVLGDREAEGIGLPEGAFNKFHGALLTFLLCIVATYWVPGLEFAQPWRADEDYVPFWNLIGREFMGQGATAAEADESQAKFEALARATQDEGRDDPVEDRVVDPPPKEVDRWPEYAAHADDPKELAAEAQLQNPEALDPFFMALARSDLGYEGAVTRVGHWGDSVLGNDGITYEIRRRMQRRFGDAGHGFHSLAKYDPSYRHQQVDFEERGAQWSRCFIIRKCKKDGFYGYGGVTVWSAGGAETRLGTVKEGPVGRKVSAFELWYAGDERGGRLQVKIDGGDPVVLDTEAPAYEDRWERFELEDGPHEIAVRAVGGGRVRAYGLVMERKGPGVVWDGMALIGSMTSRLLEQEQAHWARQLQKRDVDLVVFTFGGNDMGAGAFSQSKLDRHAETYAELIQRTKQAKPGVACLVMSPIDHGERKGGRVVSKPIVAPMVEVQKKVARDNGCAFFDTFAAMGGEGSMGRWYKSNPKLGSGDLAHPTRAGHRVIGQMVYDALMDAYADWRRAKAGTPMGPGEGDPAGEPEDAPQ